eukprot:3270939-Amphidinium_carterae.1
MQQPPQSSWQPTVVSTVCHGVHAVLLDHSPFLLWQPTPNAAPIRLYQPPSPHQTQSASGFNDFPAEHVQAAQD